MSFSLISCGSNQIDEEKTANDIEKVLEQLFCSVQKSDKDVFKTYFADEALSTFDFEDGYNYLVAQYEGEVLSIDCKTPIVQETNFVPGEHIYSAFTTLNVLTTENEYVVYIDFYTQYTSKYPDNSYKIKKFKLLTKQMLDNGENFNDCTLRNGVYYPNWPIPKVT